VFFDCVRTNKKPKADLEVGLADSTAVILSNLAMDEGRRVYFNEIDKMQDARGAGEERLTFDIKSGATRLRLFPQNAVDDQSSNARPSSHSA